MYTSPEQPFPQTRTYCNELRVQESKRRTSPVGTGSGRRRYMGKLRRRVKSPSVESRLFAEDDEKASRWQLEGGFYRHAVYWAIQAMEKYIHARVFAIYDDTATVERVKDHRLDLLIDFYIETCTPPDEHIVREHVRSQLHCLVLDNVLFAELQNDLRYLHFFRSRNEFAVVEISRCDAEEVLAKLELLKAFLTDMHQTW